MPREIKFRAWSEHRGMWYSDMLSNDDNPRHVQIYNGRIMWGVYDSVMGNRLYTGEYDEIMQYTGQKDKHTKEIYEGDIVRRGGKEEGTVEQTSFVQCTRSSFKLEAEGWDEGDDWKWDEMEVIGNIFEHPELVKLYDLPISRK